MYSFKGLGHNTKDCRTLFQLRLQVFKQLENGRPIGRLFLGHGSALGRTSVSRGARKGPSGPWVEIVRRGMQGRALRALW